VFLLCAAELDIYTVESWLIFQTASAHLGACRGVGLLALGGYFAIVLWLAADLGPNFKMKKSPFHARASGHCGCRRVKIAGPMGWEQLAWLVICFPTLLHLGVLGRASIVNQPKRVDRFDDASRAHDSGVLMRMGVRLGFHMKYVSDPVRIPMNI